MCYDDLTETSKHDREFHPHIWGGEEWITNNEKYCGKVLFINHGFISSLHYHDVKDETFMCIDGVVGIEYYTEGTLRLETTFLRGWARDAIRLKPKIVHRFWSITPSSTVIEFSTPHSDVDVTRIEEAQAI